MVSLRAHLPAYGLFHSFRNVSVRTGMYVGVFLSTVLTAWVVIANRVPLLDRYAFPRTLIAAALLGLLAIVPVLRFWRLPGNLLSSSLVGWTLFCLTYRVLCIGFPRLQQRIGVSAVQVFMLGAVAYMLVVTISWIGTIIRRARASNRPSRPVS